MNRWKSPQAEYLAHLTDSSEATLERYRYWLDAFEAYCRDQLELSGPEALYPRHFDSFRQHLLWKPGPSGRFYAPNTVYQALRMVRSFVRWFVARQGLPDPTAGLVLSRPREKSPRILSLPEVERLFEVPDQTPLGLRDRALLRLFYHGLSEEDARQLDPGHLDLTARQLEIPGRECRLELTTPLVDALLAYLREGRPALAASDQVLFPGRRGGRLGVLHLRNQVRRHGRIAGLGTVTPRILRRSGEAQLAAFRDRRLPFNWNDL